MVCFTNSVQSPIQNEPVLGWTTVIKKMTVLHRSDGERLTEDTGRRFKKKGMSTTVLDVDLKVTLTSLCVVSGSLQQSQLYCPPNLQVGPS